MLPEIVLHAGLRFSTFDSSKSFNLERVASGTPTHPPKGLSIIHSSLRKRDLIFVLQAVAKNMANKS